MSEPRHALFPAATTLPDGTVHGVTRMATDTAGTTRIWAWIDGPVEVWSGPATDLEPLEATRGRPQAFRAVDGMVIDGRGGGCGCSSPLKSWRPPLVAPAG